MNPEDLPEGDAGGLTTQQPGRRRALQWPSVLWLTVVWCLLWGEFTVGNIVAGVIVAVGLLLLFPLPSLAFSSRPHPVAMVRLAAVFIADLVVSSVQVAVQVLRFGRQPVNSVLVVPLRTRSEFAMWLTAEMVSLVPGSLLIEASRSQWTLQVHVMDTPTPESVQRARERVWAQERRVVLAFGNPDDIVRVRQPPPALRRRPQGRP
jgi:multicomponent Na+:H+ antiporter subunit E